MRMAAARVQVRSTTYWSEVGSASPTWPASPRSCSANVAMRCANVAFTSLAMDCSGPGVPPRDNAVRLRQ